MSISNWDVKTELPASILSWQFIREYIERRGYSPENMSLLPTNLEKELITAACLYSSLKMAEIKAFSHFKRKIRTGR